MVLLPQIANELLDEIIAYLPTKSDQLSLARSCRGLHWPAARRLYRRVSVSDYPARRFFKTVTESKYEYGHFTRTLDYSASASSDVHLTHLLLRDAIPKLTCLEHLDLSIRSTLSPFLLYLIKRSVDVFERSPLEFESGFFIPRANAVANTFCMLPRLQSFRLHGDIRLLKLISRCEMGKLEITEPMSEEEFNYFLHSVAPGDVPIPTLTNLTVTFQKPFHACLVYSIIRMAKCFPNLCRLSIRGLRINALASTVYRRIIRMTGLQPLIRDIKQDVSQAMVLRPPLFPCLERLEVNQISMAVPDEYLIKEGNPINVQKRHAVEAGCLRPTLSCMTFGNLGWDRVPRTSEWTMSYRINVTDDDIGMLPENFHHRPFEWFVEFTEPVEFSGLQDSYSKQLK